MTIETINHAISFVWQRQEISDEGVSVTISFSKMNLFICRLFAPKCAMCGLAIIPIDVSKKYYVICFPQLLCHIT